MKFKVFLILCISRAACAALDPVDIDVTINDNNERVAVLTARKDELYSKAELTPDELGELFDVAFKLKELKMNPINEMIDRLTGQITEQKAYLERLVADAKSNQDRIDIVEGVLKDMEDAIRKLRTL